MDMNLCKPKKTCMNTNILLVMNLCKNYHFMVINIRVLQQLPWT